MPVAVPSHPTPQAPESQHFISQPRTCPFLDGGQGLSEGFRGFSFFAGAAQVPSKGSGGSGAGPGWGWGWGWDEMKDWGWGEVGCSQPPARMLHHLAGWGRWAEEKEVSKTVGLGRENTCSLPCTCLTPPPLPIPSQIPSPTPFAYQPNPNHPNPPQPTPTPHSLSSHPQPQPNPMPMPMPCPTQPIPEMGGLGDAGVTLPE